MDESPLGGAFPHQHDDPRDLRERIGAQIRDRIAEAVEMFALRLVVERRAGQGRPAPETSNAADRLEFEETTLGLLAHLRRAFDAPLTPEERTAVAEAERGTAAGRERLLAAQVHLARRLPDYWQQLERHAAEFSAGPPVTDRPGWLGRLLPGGSGRPGRGHTP